MDSVRGEIKNVEDLRGSLVEVYQALQNGDCNLKAADTTANLAGKIIGTLKAQLVYAKLRKEKPEIEFLNCVGQRLAKQHVGPVNT